MDVKKRKKKVDTGLNCPVKPDPRTDQVFLVNTKSAGRIYCESYRLEPGEGGLMPRDIAARITARGHGSAIYTSEAAYRESI